MPTKETHKLKKELLTEFLSEQPDPVPIGVVWSGLETVNLETPTEQIKEEYATNQLYLDDCKFIGKFKLKTKHSKKSFRKWAMSRGCSRDEADAINKLVAAQKGRVSYETLYLSVISGVYFGS